jgi:hypothetical protein
MPTMSAAAVSNKVQRPDILSLGGNIEVLAAGQKKGTTLPAGIPARYLRYFRRGSLGDSDVTNIEQDDLKNLKLMNGIPGESEVEYHFLVEGNGQVTIELDCWKGGHHTETVALK